MVLALCMAWLALVGAARGQQIDKHGSESYFRETIFKSPESIFGRKDDQQRDSTANAAGTIPTSPPGEYWYEPVPVGPSAWSWQILPEGLVYRSYLAGEKESRFRSFWAHDEGHGWIWDITLGGRVGIVRYGSLGDVRPVGWQIDIEGAGIPRLDLESDRDLTSADFRFGIPISYGTDVQQIKFGYYHLSSHLGDEFLDNNPGYTRYNYTRDVIVLGYSIYPHKDLRLYAEAGWAFNSDVSEPWEYQFGVDMSPADCTGFRGAPFLALNGAMRQEVDYGGNFVVQTGWAWRGGPTSGLLRAGFEYFQGKSDQFSFYDQTESKTGLGIWYDF